MFGLAARLIRLACVMVVALTVTVGQAAKPDSAVDDSVSTSSKAISLIAAVKRQKRSAVAELLKQDIDVNQTQGDGATALHWAVHHNDLETARKLIDAGANVEAKNVLGVMPLWLACTNGSAAMIQLLIDASADPNEPLVTGETPLMTASRTGNIEAVKMLLASGANVHTTEPIRKQTALM